MRPSRFAVGSVLVVVLVPPLACESQGDPAQPLDMGAGASGGLGRPSPSDGQGGSGVGGTSSNGPGSQPSRQNAAGAGAIGGSTVQGNPTGQAGSAAGGSSGRAGNGGALASGGRASLGGARADAAGSQGSGGAPATDGGRNVGGARVSGGGSAVGAAGRGGAKAAGGSSSPGSGGAGTGAGALIRNDVFWKDTAGNPIYSQGGGVLRVGDVYYWYGVRYGGAATYATNPGKSNSDTSFVALTVYSSADLANWKFEGNALTPSSASGGATIDSGTWIGRVGAAYHPTTKKYVLIGQYQGTPNTTQFFATSDTPVGPFKWDHTQAVITNVTNSNCGDQSVFTDDDGKAYILCSNQEGRSNTYIVPLRPADFLEAQPATRIFNGAGREGNAMFKYKGRYYVCSSDLHGWNASHSYYISATNILGPYSAEAVIGGTDLDFSHVTQTGLFLTVQGSAQETIIFGGDRWSDFAGNGIGFNQWMPLAFNGTSPTMLSYSEWSIDAATGLVAVGPGNNYAMNPSFEADRVTTSSPAGWTATAGTNAQGGHSGRWAWQLSSGSTVEQKLTGLPDGTYALAVWAKGGSGTLYAKGTGGMDKSSPIATANGFTKVMLNEIAVTNGTCQLGVSSTSGTLVIDDVTLTKN